MRMRCSGERAGGERLFLRFSHGKAPNTRIAAASGEKIETQEELSLIWRDIDIVWRGFHA
ncbi:hypothetical protein DDE20_16120 [Pararhodobacter oceanensis]|uniref:Uncharacterized protein n=1 Tax=Pararhodobacter oceanensis TaxID=2172121 RepID=A0A2T8HQD3_9RHOB|nr:hypothetical protein DDE20_16120 [Pararhodobacter oceanensis]